MKVHKIVLKHSLIIHRDILGNNRVLHNIRRDEDGKGQVKNIL